MATTVVKEHVVLDLSPFGPSIIDFIVDTTTDTAAKVRLP